MCRNKSNVKNANHRRTPQKTDLKRMAAPGSPQLSAATRMSDVEGLTSRLSEVLGEMQNDTALLNEQLAVANAKRAAAEVALVKANDRIQDMEERIELLVEAQLTAKGV